MALNISLPSTVFSLMESKRWYDASGVAIKDVQTQIQFTSVYVDVSPYVRSIDIDASVNNLSGEPGANRAGVEFDNADKRFSDLYAAGPYYGSLLPGRPVRIQLSIGVSTVTLFQGRVSQAGFSETRDGNQGSATIEVLDDADLMQRRKFSKDYYYTDKKLVDESDAGNSLLHILLQNHFSMASADIVTNGDVMYTVPYTLFKEGESIWGKIQDIATACLAQYCGFRHDGKFVMESRLTTGWSVPVSEYALVASTLDATVSKSIEPLIGNRVKVRGPIMELMNDAVVWELRKVKPVGANAVYPGWCWEPVASGDFYLSDPTADPVQEYWAQYEVDGGEIIHVQSLALSQKIWQGASFELETTGTSLLSESRRGQLVLQNSAAQTVHVMNLQVKGTAVIRRSISRKLEEDKALEQILHDQGLSDDDFNWGRVGILSNASSISAYGQTDRVIDSDFICSDEQLEKIADWHLQYGKDPKHRFDHEGLPFMAFVQPGAVINFSLTELGYSAPVEVEGFTHRITPDGAQTSFRMVETPSEWSVANSVTVKQVVVAPSGGTGESEVQASAGGGNLKFYIGANGCSLPVDILCDGVGDHAEWNEAIVEMASRGGGTVVGIGGTFVTSAPISMLANVTIELDAGATIEKNGNYNGIEALGTATTAMSAIAIVGGGLVTRNAGDTNAANLIHFENVDDFLISAIGVDNGYDNGIYIDGGTNGEVGGDVNIRGCGGTGLKIISCAKLVAAALAITSCAIGCEMWPDMTINNIANGNCESTSPPMLNSEMTSIVDTCTWARDASVAYSGTYSYKLTATSAGTPSVSFADELNTTDMHGLSVGMTYLVKAMLYIPTGMINAGDIELSMYEYDGAWSRVAYVTPRAVYDEWQEVSFIHIIGASATGIYLEIYVASAAENDILYADEMGVYEFDPTDSGCQLVNSSVDECADGVIIANSHAIIQNNQVTGCKSTGITIAAGYRNMVTNNRAYNNGDDTDLSNENEHNFYDAGVDTQLSGNSWQSPISGEPSWGTPHTHNATLVSGVDPTTTANTTVTCSSVPNGTRAIFGRCSQNSATASRILNIKDSGGTVYCECMNAAAGGWATSTFVVPIDSSKQFLYNASNADMAAVYIYQLGYFI